MNNLLFVYGTLMQPGNEFAIYLNTNCSFLSTGRTKGTLYDIGSYPGLIINSISASFVHGSIYKMNAPAVILKELDFYEGVGPDEEQPNLYTRKIKIIETDFGPHEAWVYIYNLPVYGYKVIPSGDYAEYIKQKKSPGYKTPGDL
jgi:gamma-glutamylcyclotransferase (GGCT)/AIG2-like uncharacterized protein YtfP